MNELARAMHSPLRHADGGSYRQLSVLYHAAKVAGLKPSPKKAQTHVFFQTPPCHPSGRLRQHEHRAAVFYDSASVARVVCPPSPPSGLPCMHPVLLGRS